MIQLTKALKLLHSTGYVHNDLKASNFMVDNVENLLNGKKFKITLIDFGYASKFIDKHTGKHLA